ncbi:hypothetical protein F4803DRAFT_526040 [Xylaria telfairii]|nr:hypothetical protein F4803DRAFT_526040 [Xylaria telfairii]
MFDWISVLAPVSTLAPSGLAGAYVRMNNLRSCLSDTPRTHPTIISLSKCRLRSSAYFPYLTTKFSYLSYKILSGQRFAHLYVQLGLKMHRRDPLKLYCTKAFA